MQWFVVFFSNTHLLFFLGIKLCLVALLTQKAEVHYLSNKVNVQDVISNIESIGFKASLLEDAISVYKVLELHVCF